MGFFCIGQLTQLNGKLKYHVEPITLLRERERERERFCCKHGSFCPVNLSGCLEAVLFLWTVFNEPSASIKTLGTKLVR